jgi:hypothetical protein
MLDKTIGEPVPTQQCEACGDTTDVQEVTIEYMKGFLCAHCRSYWQSEEGRQEIIADQVEKAERKAGWDPNP